ncbi:transglutaminase domain-containing protein [Tenacibaculum soleae]|uniref:Transglutaminase-like domain-containing protein n=1 Tax=Tenacibaculum soleae TaxID=447689 RepID=A0A1B9Y093_9FLAO|nr:transglutaminase domain-containing protein [Tenacibaculum soleae]MDO6813569.1 DUF3857 domain-containing protein [Tenacibaculum soleae]OCK43235.1 hypothetical protein BA195_00585 [Tenacibaculum soleae]
MKKTLLLFTLLISLTINSQKIKFGKVSKTELEEKLHPLDSTADAIYLLKEKKIEYEFSPTKGWTTKTYVRETIKILNKNGYKFSKKEIKLLKNNNTKENISSLKAYTFNLNENKIERTKLTKKDIFKEQKNKYLELVKFTMPNVKPFCIIDLSYTITSPFTSSISEIYLQNNIPIKKLDVIVKIPEYFVTKKHIKGFLHFNIKESIENKTIPYKYDKMVNQQGGYVKTKFEGNLEFKNYLYIIQEENVPRLKSKEVFSSNIHNYRAAIKFETSVLKFPNSVPKYLSTNWKNISKTIYESPYFGRELEKNNYYKDDLKSIIGDSKNNFEKALSIFQFLKFKVKWNRYYSKYTDKGVKKAYKEGTGNSAEINLMLTSMLRFAGLDANPVLISTKNSGVPLFPTVLGFNYVISKVNFSNGKYILLDATDPYSAPNVIPQRALNWYGREILTNGDSRKVELTPTKHSKENNILYVKIDADLGEVTGMYRKSLSGHAAMFYRQLNNIKKEDEIITSIEEKLSIEVNDFKILNKENTTKSITQTLKFTSEDLIEKVNEKLYFSPLLFLATSENPFKTNERNYPIDYIIPWQDKFTVSITVPEGYIVESFPKESAIALPDNLGVFKYLVTVQGNKIKLSSILQFNTQIINQQYYGIVKNFYKKLVEKQTENIVLIKK